MKRCKNCGQRYNDKMKFCVVCGTQLTDEEAIAEENETAAETADSTAAAATAADTAETADSAGTAGIADSTAAAADSAGTAADTADTADSTETTAGIADSADTAAEEPLSEEIFTEEFPEAVETALEEVTAGEDTAGEITPEEVTARVIQPQEVTAKEVNPRNVAADEYAETVETEEFSEFAEDIMNEPANVIEHENYDVIEFKAKKPKLTARRVIAGFFAAILGVVCFAAITFAGVSYTARYLSYGETVESIIASVDILNLPLDDTPMGEAGGTVLEAVYASSDGMGLTEDDIRSIYEDATFREDLARIVALYTDFIRTGEYPAAVTTDTIKDIFEDNIDVINRVLERAGEPPLDELNRAVALASIDSADEVLKSISFENISKSDSLINPVGLVRMAISPAAIIGELALAALIMLIIGLITKSVRTPFFIGGLSLTLSGAVIAAALYLFENSAIVVVQNNAVQIIVSDIARYLGGQIYGICAVGAAAGVVMMVISQIRLKKKAAKVNV